MVTPMKLLDLPFNQGTGTTSMIVNRRDSGKLRWHDP
jgi:hypothetical protein